MDDDRIAALRRFLGSVPSRREVLRGLAGAGLGVAAARLPDVAEAKRNRKHKSKSKKPKPNAFGCLSVGVACTSEDQCCSGICQGKKGKKQCLNHGVGTCSQVVEGTCTSSDPAQDVCNNRPDCLCARTTAGSNFCARVGDFDATECAECTKDADCEALRFPRGSACAPMTEGRCAGTCRGNMACLVPCNVAPPTN